MLGALPRELMQHIHYFMEFEDSTMTVQILRMLHVLTRKSTLLYRCYGSGLPYDAAADSAQMRMYRPYSTWSQQRRMLCTK